MTLFCKPQVTPSASNLNQAIRRIVQSSIVLSAFAASVSWSQPDNATLRASDIDWTPLQDLSPEQQSQISNACCGLYIEPELPLRTSDPAGTEITTDDQTALNDEIILTGNIQIFQTDAYIQADQGIYQRNTEILTLQDNVRIRQPGMLLVGAAARIDQGAQSSQIEEASYVLHESGIRGQAEIIVYTDADGIITIDNGLYTRCEPGDASWVIAATKMTLDQESGRGVARNVTLQINNIPVLYTPYMSFPIDDRRVSGFLAPSFGSSRDGGFDIAVPYYFNLAPHYDATLTPRLITDRGAMISLEGRRRGQNWNNLLDLNYLASDDLFDPATANTPDSDSPSQEERWLIGYNYNGYFGPNWSARADFSAVSDGDYFQDLGNGGLYNTSQSYLNRNAQLQYLNENWSFKAKMQGFQVIDPSVSELNLPYEILPSFNLDGNFSTELGMEYGLKTQYVYFDRNISRSSLTQNQIDNGAFVTGQRLTVEPEISWPWSTPGMFVTPTAKYKYATYQLDQQNITQTDTPSRGIFSASIDSGLIFERDIEFDSNDFTQTLEPRLYYLYSEYEDQSDIPIFDSADMTFGFNQLFRDDRFSGKDRVGDSNQLTMALTTRFLDSRGREKAQASIGQIIYFEDRKVTLFGNSNQTEQDSTSVMVGSFSYQFNDNWRVTSYLEFNSEESSIDTGNFQFRYQSDINHIFNFSYRYRDQINPINSLGLDQRTDQTDISGLWPLNDKWGLIGRWNYDLANERDLESIIGLEYSNCCWNVRLVARQWIDNGDLFLDELEENQGVFLQFELKGLGSVLGGSISTVLGNAILGYREHEYVN